MHKKRHDSERKTQFAEPLNAYHTLSSSPTFFIKATADLYSEEPITCLITYPYPNDNRPYTNICIYEHKIRALLDSGSNLTLINDSVYSSLNPRKIKPLQNPIKLRTAGGEPLEILGQIYLPFTFNGVTKIIPTLVVPKLAIRCICGMDFWAKFNIQPTVGECALIDDFGEEETTQPTSSSILTIEEQRVIQATKKLFLPARKGQLSLTPLTEHRIEIKEEWKDKPPVRQFPYVMSPKTLGLVGTELQRLLDTGIIERSNSSWSLNCVPVIKPHKVRLCLDARKINERTVRDAYPLPHPCRILGQLPKANYLSTIDLSEAFLQIPLHPASRKYTAFSVQGKGLFQYTRMPFGLVNSPATLARLMDHVLGHGVLEPYVFVYLDDIVVVTETFEHHVQLLREIARRLREANLSINLEKSQFGVPEIPFLGYLLSTQGLRANPEKTRPIIEYERPNSITKLRRFLGMVNYYRRFISDFSEITAALTDLLKTTSKIIKWTDEAEKSFCVIKERLVSAPILGSPDFTKEFTIQTDASDVAVAAVLTQKQKDCERVISYYSHKLTTPQRNYHAAEKEALAALLAIDHFRGYIEGYHFKLITDSSALTHILNTKWKVGSRCSRWSLNLQQFDMSVVHRKGKDNIVPDALSRSVAVVLDPSTASWHTSLVENVLSNPDDYADFRLEDGKLMKFVIAKNEPYDSRFEWKIVPSPDEISVILKENHDDTFHQGYEKTLARIQKRFYWPKMGSTIRSYIQACTTCKEIKAPFVAVTPEMGKMRQASYPWQIISIDFVGPLPRSRKGNQHLLVITDYFSKWVMLHPVRKLDSSAMCGVLKEQWFYRNSVPEIIITDNGSTFIAKVFKDLLDQFGITHWLNSRYHSQANPVERVNRTINTAIRTYVREDQRLWDTKIAEIELILNTTKHTSTGFTPYFITHGFELSEKGEDHRLLRHDQLLSDDEREERRKQTLSKIYDIVKSKLAKAHESSTKHYNLRSRRFAKSFSVGQLVFRRNMKQSSAADNYNSKYGPQYLPCKVKAKIGTSSYDLEDLTGKSLGVWPAIHLKPG